MFRVVEKYRNLFKILLGLIALSFVTFGVTTFGASRNEYVTKIGDDEIEAREIRGLSNMYSAVPNAQTIAGIYAFLAEETYLSELALSKGYDHGAEGVRSFMEVNPMFRGEDGKFSPEAAGRFISNIYGTEERYVKATRRELRSNLMLSLALAGGFAPVSTAKADSDALLGQRDIAVFDPASLDEAKQSAQIDDKAVKAFYDANPKLFSEPKAVKVEWIELSTADIAKNEKVSDEEIDLKAAEIKKAMQNGAKKEDGKEDGKKEGKKDGKGQEEAQGNAKTGDGADADKPFDKEQIKTELALTKARKAFGSVREELSDVTFNTPTSFGPAVEKFGAHLRSSEGFVEEGNVPDSIPPVVAKAMFEEDADSKNNSEVLTDKETLYSFRVTESKPSRITPFEQAQGKARELVAQKAAVDFAQNYADAAADKLNAGTQTDDLKWARQGAMTLNEAIQAFSPETAYKIAFSFPAGKPIYISGQDKSGKRILLKLENFDASQVAANARQAVNLGLEEVRAAAQKQVLLQEAKKAVKEQPGNTKLADI